MKSREKKIFLILDNLKVHHTLKATLDEHISSFKELIVEDCLLEIADCSKTHRDNSFRDQARDLGAFLAHEILDGVSQVTAVIPQFCEEIGQIGAIVFSESLSQNNNFLSTYPTENYENLIAEGHQKIDHAFSTEQAERYIPEAKENRAINNFDIGILPPPGLLSGGSGAVMDGRITATMANSTYGWAIGQPINNLTKSGNVPKWSTVRSRHWKNQAEWAKSNPHEYGAENILRMEQGLAPQRINPNTEKIESMELHHNPAQRNGGRFDFTELWPDEHAELDKSRRLGG